MTDKGYLVVSELCWLRNNVPAKVKEYLRRAYPAIKTIDENLNIAKRVGYGIVGFFVLPTESWWTEYHNPILAKLSSLKKKYKK